MVKKNKKKTGPEPENTATLDFATAMLQAANALCQAESLASQRGDVDSLMRVASIWNELADSLHGSPDRSDVTSEHPIGFESYETTLMRQKKQDEIDKSKEQSR